ncbi:hypothetical protein Tco_0368556 [Tanacetum coccineum]
MADLKFVDQHNMVANLENSDENAEFHQIVDFLSTCSINYAFTVSPTIYASYIEQFWNTTTSKTINSVKQIYAIVDGKAVVILESSVRSDLLFNDEDGLKDLPEPFNDTYVTPCHTKKVFSNMARKSVNFSGNITLLFASMLVQNQAPEGKGSTIHPEPQPTPSTSQPNVSEPQITSLYIETSPTEAHQNATRSKRVPAQPNEPPLSEGHTSGSGKGRMEHTFELTDNVPSTPHDSPLPGGYTPESDEGRMKLDELITLCIKLSKQVLDLEKEMDAQAGRRSDKLEPMFNDKDFEELDDYMENVKEETVDAATTGVSTTSALVSTIGVTISTAEPRTPPTTTTVFDDEDVTMAMAQTLIKMKELKAKEKGVAIIDVEDSSRIVIPIRSITTLQPLLTIDPKDKGKGVLIKEEPVKIKMRDQGDLQFDEIQARIDANHELAVRLTHEEQEKYTIEERARLLAEFF